MCLLHALICAVRRAQIVPVGRCCRIDNAPDLRLSKTEKMLFLHNYNILHLKVHIHIAQYDDGEKNNECISSYSIIERNTSSLVTMNFSSLFLDGSAELLRRSNMRNPVLDGMCSACASCRRGTR